MIGPSASKAQSEETIKQNVYSINQADRLREPGDDDGPWSGVGAFDEDPFEGLGSQRDLSLWEEGRLGLSYLDNLCTEGGGRIGEEKEEFDNEVEYRKEIERSKACQHTCVVLSTDDFADYLHPLDCRKAWCPICGGKGGRVHKARKKAVRRRVNVELVNLRYFVFTVPLEHRCRFQSRKGLNQLFTGAKNLVKRFFGGEGKGAVATMHLYGDPRETGEASSVYHPHVNVVIPEEAGLRLQISKEMLAEIKASWRRCLVGLGCHGIEVVDVFYEFRIDVKHKAHCLKYIVRPTWDAETLKVVNQETRYFLVLELKGFQYVRFWGALANSEYREGAMETIREAIEESEKIVGKKLNFRAVCTANIAVLLRQGKIEKVAENLYRIKKGERVNG